jgi:hypothetical protein
MTTADSGAKAPNFMKAFAAACALAGAALLLTACLSTPKTEQAASVGQEEVMNLDDAEAEMVALKTAPSGIDRGKAEDLVNRLASMRQAKVLQKYYLIRLYALSGEAYLLSGDPVSAKTMLKDADDLSGYGSQSGKADPAPLLRCLSVPDAKKRLSLMESSTMPALWRASEGGVPPRLQCELGLLYLGAGRYAEALSSFDAALARLPAALRQGYAPSREACAQALSAGVSKANASYAEARPLTLGLLARAIWTEAPELLPSRAEFATDDNAIILALADARLLPIAADRRADRPAQRQDAVLTLFALYVRRSGEKGLDARYTRKYAPSAASADKKGKSPVPDLDYDLEIFDEALALVEREVIDLPDGKNFKPRAELNGVDFLGMLKRLPPRK